MEQPEQNIVAQPEQQTVTDFQAPEAARDRPVPATGEHIFDVKDVSVFYGSFRAVTNVTLTIYEHQITAFIGPSGCGKTTVLRSLNRMNDLVVGAHVEGEIRYRGASLSGGQAQRLCIARTLAVEPDVVLMDEPASALDPIATGAIEDLMQEIKQKYTIVIVTHNMQQATRVSDRTAFYSVIVNPESDTRTGTLVEYAPTAELFGDPKDERTKSYVTGRMG